MVEYQPEAPQLKLGCRTGHGAKLFMKVFDGEDAFLGVGVEISPALGFPGELGPLEFCLLMPPAKVSIDCRVGLAGTVEVRTLDR